MYFGTIVYPYKLTLYYKALLVVVFILEAFMFPTTPHGQGLVEYALVILLVGILVIVMLAIFGSGVGNMFSNVIANF
jgi:pilus assembly protein Flp/PilA